MKLAHKIITLSTILITLCIFNSASALEYQSTSQLEFTVNPTVSVSVSGDLTISNLSPGSSSDSNTITVTASSNAISGYSLSSTVGDSNNASSELRKDNTNTTYKFSSITTNKPTLSDFDHNNNTWGYSYSTDSGSTWISGDITITDPTSPLYPTTGYNGLPLYTTDTPITLINAVSEGTNTIFFKIAASSTQTQVAGEYNNIINFIALANNNPEVLDKTFDEAFLAAGKTKYKGYYTMQDMNRNICAATKLDEKTQLIDTRDDTIYLVAKAKDYNCWMIENLKLGRTVTSSNPSLTITSANSDITSEYTLNYSDIPPYGEFHAYTIDDIPDQNNSTEYYCTGNDTTNDWGSCYYNWYTATAGAGTTSSSYGTNVETSICPASWTIPTVQQFSGLHTQYNSPALILVDDPTTTKENSAGKIPGFLLSGEYRTTGALYRGYFGGYWSRIAYDAQTAFNMGVYTFSADVIGHTSKYYGFAVRCIAN